MKRQIANYAFVKGGAGVGTVTFSDFTTIRLDGILLIDNVTRGIQIYNAFDPTKLGTVATNVLTLAADTSAQNNADKLYIVYDDSDLDYDTGAGIAHRLASGLIVPGAGGPVAITGDAANGLDVDVTRSVLPTGAASSALQGAGLPAAFGAGGGVKVDGSGTALPVSGTVTVSNPVTQWAEDAAHVSGDLGIAALAVRTDVPIQRAGTDGDYAVLETDADGKLWVNAGTIRTRKLLTPTTITASTAETTIIAAVASEFHDLYGLTLTNTGVTATKVSIRDDTAGTVKQVLFVPAGATVGFTLEVSAAIPQTAQNKNWTAQCGSSTSSLEVTALYIKVT